MLMPTVFIWLPSVRRAFASRCFSLLIAVRARARLRAKTVSLGALFGFQDQWVVQTARRRDRFHWLYAVVLSKNFPYKLYNFHVHRIIPTTVCFFKKRCFFNRKKINKKKLLFFSSPKSALSALFFVVSRRWSKAVLQNHV